MTAARGRKAFVVVKALFWITVGLIVAAYMGLEGIKTYRIMRGGSQAPAQVVATFDDERESDDGRRVGIVTVAVYEFSVGGVRFTGKTDGSQGSWSTGDKLRVEFNPQNPNENRMVGDRGVLGDLFTLVLFGGLFAYFAIRLNLETLLELRRAGRSGAAGTEQCN